MNEPSKADRKAPRFPWRWLAAGLAAAAVGAALYFWLQPAAPVKEQAATFTARQGPLEVMVLEGYMITEEDVKNGRVIVELDKKQLEDMQVEQELSYQNALAAYKEAKEQYDIQVNQNESDVKQAELDAKFARMDLEKYLGKGLAGTLLAKRTETAAEAPAASSETETAAEEDAPISLHMSFSTHAGIDFTQYADPERLGDGEARQRLRQLDDDLALAREEVGLAETNPEGTERLYEKDFVTKNDLDNDAIRLKRQQINLESAATSKELFIKYEFPKEAERLLSQYEEALRKLERMRKTASAKLAQSEAKLNSAEARLDLQTRRRDELEEQIAKCTIRATQPGMVIYGGGNRSFYRDNDRIEEGATVRERQVILTIPDTGKMVLDVDVHESAVKQVAAGQPVRIRVDAFPSRPLEGTVEKIAVIPDSQNRWINPDLKVYSTTIFIDGAHPWLKPGMSAEAEIIVEQLDDVVQVPLQAVHTDKGERVCYVVQDGAVDRRPVETGAYNEVFIQIRSGVEPGEAVLLRAPGAAGGSDAPEPGPGPPGKEDRNGPPGQAA